MDVEDRYQNAAILITSQLPVDKCRRHRRPTIRRRGLDRIVHQRAQSFLDGLIHAKDYRRKLQRQRRPRRSKMGKVSSSNGDARRQIRPPAKVAVLRNQWPLASEYAPWGSSEAKEPRSGLTRRRPRSTPPRLAPDDAENPSDGSLITDAISGEAGHRGLLHAGQACISSGICLSPVKGWSRSQTLLESADELAPLRHLVGHDPRGGNALFDALIAATLAVLPARGGRVATLQSRRLPPAFIPDESGERADRFNPATLAGGRIWRRRSSPLGAPLMSFSFGVVNVVGVEVFGDSLSHGWPVEVDPVRVVDAYGRGWRRRM